MAVSLKTMVDQDGVRHGSWCFSSRPMKKKTNLINKTNKKSFARLSQEKNEMRDNYICLFALSGFLASGTKIQGLIAENFFLMNPPPPPNSAEISPLPNPPMAGVTDTMSGA